MLIADEVLGRRTVRKQWLRDSEGEDSDEEEEEEDEDFYDRLGISRCYEERTTCRGGRGGRESPIPLLRRMGGELTSGPIPVFVTYEMV